jgi:DNA-binding MarR family transcriptional regulator
MEEYDALELVTGLRGKLDYVFFKSFMKTYSLPEGMNHAHIGTLMFLSFIGVAPMSKLSRRVNLEKGSFTPVANKLIEMKLIQKKRNESDRRVYELSLTDEGIILAEDVKKEHMLYIEDKLKSLDKDQIEEFFTAIKLVTTTIEKLDDNPEDICLSRMKKSHE